MLKTPVGKNFRAISEATIIKKLNEAFKLYYIDYSITVKENHLDIRESGGKLVFIATCLVRLDFFMDGSRDPIAYCEALGMGIDDGDKAMGKAYTYAIKYALMKKFRITYSDDPDAEASKPIDASPEEEKKPKGEKPKAGKGSKGKSEEKEGTLITEKMSNYIIGLVKDIDMPDKTFKERWGYYPSSDKIPMKLAREIIEQLKKMKDEDLPF